MLRKLQFTLLMLLMASPALKAAAHKPGSFGVGWYSFDAPIGGPLWVLPNIGVDLGVGFDKTGFSNDKTNVVFDMGVPFDVVQTEKVKGGAFKQTARKSHRILRNPARAACH